MPHARKASAGSSSNSVCDLVSLQYGKKLRYLQASRRVHWPDSAVMVPVSTVAIKLSCDLVSWSCNRITLFDTVLQFAHRPTHFSTTLRLFVLPC